MNTTWTDDERLVDLLAKQATEALDEGEERELAERLAALPAAERQAATLEPAAAAVWLAAELPEEPMPAALAARIIAAGEAAVRAQAAAPQVATAEVIELPVGRRRNALPPQAGWWAAAACLVLAVTGWYPRLAGQVGTVPVVAQVPPPPPLTAAQQREALLARGSVIRAEWTQTPDPSASELVGDVVWDPATQRGFMRFRNIPANDPRLAQYQLWVVDAARTERQQPQPVDGGLFNVSPAAATADGDVIIPFEAKLPVGKPAAFAVTIEQPGGVVVSKQEHVLALAPVTTL
jgi:Anti-sigma-K factor rskA